MVLSPAAHYMITLRALFRFAIRKIHRSQCSPQVLLIDLAAYILEKGEISRRKDTTLSYLSPRRDPRPKSISIAEAMNMYKAMSQGNTDALRATAEPGVNNPAPS